MMKTFLRLMGSLALCAAICGCSNYRLAGTPVDLPFKTVYVKPVKNFSYAPQAANLLTNAISDAISQTPQIRAANAGDADAVLEVEITDYQKRPYATKSTDTALAAAFKVTATAECTLTAGGRSVFKRRPVSASVILYPRSGDLANSEYQNMPVLMRELGVKVKDAAIGIW